MNNLARVRAKLREANTDVLLVPSTDEFLSEFAELPRRRLEWLTGFTGSVGFALVSTDKAALFVKPLYVPQAKQEVSAGFDVLEWDETAAQTWLRSHARAGGSLAIDPRLHSYSEAKQLIDQSLDNGFQVRVIRRNPVDEIWGPERPQDIGRTVIDYPLAFAGESRTEKRTRLQARLVGTGVDCHLVCDPEDVAWLLNVRLDGDLQSGNWHVVPAPLSRVCVTSAGDCTWFVDSALLSVALRDRIGAEISIVEPKMLDPFIRSSGGQRISANLDRTPYNFSDSIESAGNVQHDPVVSRWRWVKNQTEVLRAREGHLEDAKAVVSFVAWIKEAVQERTITELDAAKKIQEFRARSSAYRGISAPAMSASGPNAAIPHYIPSERTNRALNEHPIYWLDSGGQYFGCSTDNTISLALGRPAAAHVLAHTLVVRGWIALARTRCPDKTSSARLDQIARQYLWQHGMDFCTGTGHGVGSFLNIHEGPYVVGRADHPMVAPIEPGMIITNEPGYYGAEFGLRVESHLLVVSSSLPGFLEFETISRLPIDPVLVDPNLLTNGERRWLADYHELVLSELGPKLDREAVTWLENATRTFVQWHTRGPDA